MKSREHGRLVGEVLRKRKIDTWRFASPARDDPDNTLVAEVFIVADYRGSLSFEARSMAFDGAMKNDRVMKNTDIEELRKAVEDQFRKQDLARRKLEWEAWIEIVISGYVSRDVPGAALDITYSIIKRCLDPKTGEPLTINSNNIVVPFPLPKKAGERDPGASADDAPLSKWRPGRDESNQYAYVPATSANRAAVKSIVERLRELRERLNGVLDQDTIQLSLQSAWKDLPRLESK